MADQVHHDFDLDVIDTGQNRTERAGSADDRPSA
jgi:hypothetical protein